MQVETRMRTRKEASVMGVWCLGAVGNDVGKGGGDVQP